MTAPRWRAGHSWTRRGGGFFDADAEALQTDVMRFMAVLGFVLVAIFALVQAIPLTSGDRHPKLEQRAELRDDVAELRQHVAERRRQLERVRARLEAALAVRDRLREQTQAAQRALERAATKARAVKAELGQHRRALDNVEAALGERRQSLQTLRARVEQRRRALRAVEQRFAELRSEAEDARHLRQRFLAEARRAAEAEAEAQAKRTAEEATRRSADSHDTGPQPAQSQTVSSEAVDADASSADGARELDADGVPERGFVLKFQSEAAFDRLVEEREVQFYALVGDRAWQARHAGGATRFTASRPPGEYHEMAPATVPPHYVQSFRRAVAAMDKDAVTWATVLPTSLKHSIQQVIADETAAAVIIQKDGSVRLKSRR